ncbi:MAG: TonB-dependent receptor [Bacteroidales bacterium]|nr:TonB-dependent receptor [Bacteroidales bacterium]
MKEIFAALIFLAGLNLVSVGNCCSAQVLPKKVTISGYVSDSDNGEMLAGVTIYENTLKTGTSTNAYGFYSLTIPAGNYNLQYSYIGYQTLSQKGVIEKDITMNISIKSAETTLGEVIVEGKRTDENVRSTEMSLVKLDIKTIRMVPSLLGEVDLIKVLQLLPGVQPTSEGATGFSVRGGSADQNLIILDEATVYNASHLMGFFSVFNNDAVKNVTLYKGDIPAAYGGRLSSLLDVQMKDGNSKKTGFSGSIGTISSKLTVEGPVKKDRTTYLIAGRRTYADLFLPFAKDKNVRDNKLYFYDLNLKLSHVINDKNRLYLSGYFGRDVFKNPFSSIGFGNQTASVRWNHLFSQKLFFNLSLIYSRYNYQIGTPEDEPTSFVWNSKLGDYSARFDFTHYLSGNHKLRYGATTMYHQFNPGSVHGTGTNSIYSDFVLPPEYALDHSLYISDDYKVTGNFSVKYGLRLSAFQNIGPATIYSYDTEYSPVDSTVYGKNKIFNTYVSLEPRIAFTYILNDISSVKGSYSHTVQYITLAQNSTAGTPLDIWFPATPNVRPQVSDQLSAGYFRNFRQNMYEVSGELYYKTIGNLIDFRDHAQLFLNQYLESELRIGRGYAYGIEALVRKDEGRFTGWISYTWSRSFRIIPEINYGNRYCSPYDKPHSLNIVTNFEISKRISASATWIYATGLPVTFPTGRAVVGNAIIPIYSNRNDYRMPDYHRLDLSVTFKGRADKKWHDELNLSVYNVYNRHNAWAINFVRDANDPNVTYAEKTYLFAIIPALTYNVKF